VIVFHGELLSKEKVRLLAAVRNQPSYRVFWPFASAFLILVASLYWPYVPPGSDGDANSTYEVMRSLLEDFQYHISRTPGQPALDLINMVSFALGGKVGLVGIYLLICLLGITAFYRIGVAHGVRYPFLNASCLLLSPLFVAHVTGLGDFSVSLSLFLICLDLLTCRRYNLAALVYVAAIGCRLSYCLFMFPLMYYIDSIERAANPRSASYAQAVRFAAVSAAASVCLFLPLFALYGISIFRNLGWQSFSYHVSSSLYKLICGGLGLTLSLLMLVLIVLARGRVFRRLSSAESRSFDTFLFMMMSATFLIFFFIPTKPEILLPLLAALILYVGRHYPLPALTCMLVSIIFSGVVHLDLRDPADDSLALRLANGFYFQAYNGAHENRRGGEEIKQTLAGLPPRTLLVGNFKPCYPPDEKSRPLSAMPAWNTPDAHADSTLRLLTSLIRFQEIEAKYFVSFQDEGLNNFLKMNATLTERVRYQICYDPRYLPLVRRWQKINLSGYGRPVKINNAEVGFLPSEGLLLLRFPNFPSWFRGLPRGTWGLW
jgi:hypothetical protein